eukprot:SAG11_NODE_1415_length_4977_cov_6.362444_5_plen_88_part_00
MSRSPSPVRQAAVGLGWGVAAAWFGARKLQAEVKQLRRATTTVDEDYFDLLENELRGLRADLKLERRRLRWAVGAAFFAGLVLGWLL